MSTRGSGLGWVMDRKGDWNSCCETLKEAAAVKATTTATTNKNTFNIPLVFLGGMVTAGAKCRNPVLEKDLREKTTKVDENLMPRVNFPGAEDCSEPVVKRLWNGQASEDREEWMEEVKVHCARCHDD